jgi:hypothetical protein
MTQWQGRFRKFRRSFDEFYEQVYLPDHAAPLNRWVHFLSNLSAILFCGLGVYYFSLYLFAVGVFCQLGPPYLGHILFEKTHRSIDQSPIFAALGSWYTTFQILLGEQSITHGKYRSKQCTGLDTAANEDRQDGRIDTRDNHE